MAEWTMGNTFCNVGLLTSKVNKNFKCMAVVINSSDSHDTHCIGLPHEASLTQ